MSIIARSAMELDESVAGSFGDPEPDDEPLEFEDLDSDVEFESPTPPRSPNPTRRTIKVRGVLEKGCPKEEVEAGFSSTVSIREKCLVILDFLISEGFREAALTLCEEAGICLPASETESLDVRVVVREMIMNGKIKEAVDKINSVNPKILEDNPAVAFAIHQQQLIELIREGKVLDAFAYAQQHLQQPTLTDQQKSALEQSLSLGVYDTPESSPFNSLLSQEQRQITSTAVNSALLKAQKRPTQPRIETLMRMGLWAKMNLGDAHDENYLRDVMSKRAPSEPRYRFDTRGSSSEAM